MFLGQAVMACKRAFDQRVDVALEPVGVALHGPFPKKHRVAEREQPPLAEQPFQPSIAAADIAVSPPPFLSGRLRVGLVVPRVSAFLQEPLPLAVPVVQRAAPRRRLAGVPHLRQRVGEPACSRGRDVRSARVLRCTCTRQRWMRVSGQVRAHAFSTPRSPSLISTSGAGMRENRSKYAAVDSCEHQLYAMVSPVTPSMVISRHQPCDM